MQPFLRFFVAAVLLFAALAKAHLLATVPTLPQDGWFGFLETRWVQIIAIEFDVLWALLLIFNPFPRLIGRGTAVLFTVFTAISAAKWLLGEASCGCFGRVEINPLYTAIVDAVIVGMLMMFRPTIQSLHLSFRQIGRQCVLVVGLWLLVGLPLLYVMLSTQFFVLDAKNGLTGEETSVTLEPMRWLGKPFPLADVLEDAVFPDGWKQGEWRILLHHRGCAVCEKILEELAKRPDTVLMERLAVIEVPEGNAVKLPDSIQKQAGLVASLRRDLIWFAPTPVVMKIKNGMVVKVQVGNSARDLLFEKMDSLSRR